MKKLILLSILLSILMANCIGGRDTPHDLIIIMWQGETITDVWKLRNVHQKILFDGWEFEDKNGNLIRLEGNVKVIQVNDITTWEKYFEYHSDEKRRMER